MPTLPVPPATPLQQGRGPRYRYARRRPETTPLYQIVRDNLETLYAAIEQGFASELPKFVEDEFESFLRCGIASCGFALLSCEDCPEKKLVAWSCKGRAFCPSCLGRRMAQGAANLVEHVLPPNVPLRQFVISFPFELRTRLAYDGKLLSAVSRIAVDSVLGFYQRHMRGLEPTLRGKSGAVTVVQRVNQDLRLNPHLHCVALDGVFAPAADGTLIFHPLPELDSTDVADLLQVIRVRVLRFLERCGVIENDSAGADLDTLTLLPDDFADRQPALAQLAAASVSGLLPAGPERRDRPPIPFGFGSGIEITAPLTASSQGFSLHAATTVAAEDGAGREALCRYILRPPVSNERIEHAGDNLVRIRFRRAFRDGTSAIELDPLSLLVRLAASVPAPKFNTVRYAGVLAANSKWRSQIVPPLPEPDADADDGDDDDDDDVTGGSSKPPTHRSVYRPYQELMKRSFQIDVEKCDRCSGKMKLQRLVTGRDEIERILRKLGLPTEPPQRAPARGPPFFLSPVVRRQLEMFR